MWRSTFFLLVFVSSFEMPVVLGTFCGKMESTGKKTWKNPTGVCTDCSCVFTGYTTCFGGCNNQKLYYNLQPTNLDPYASPNIASALHFCSMSGFTQTSKSVDCTKNDGTILDIASITINVPTACTCQSIGGDVLQNYTTENYDFLLDYVEGEFEDSSVSETIITH